MTPLYIQNINFEIKNAYYIYNPLSLSNKSLEIDYFSSI